MLIGQLAAETGATIKALRYYEEQGLLHPRRAQNGYRDYDESAIVRVENIRLLLSLGLTALDVRHFLPCLDEAAGGAPVCPDSVRLLSRKLAEVEEKIAKLDVFRARLRAALSGAR